MFHQAKRSSEILYDENDSSRRGTILFNDSQAQSNFASMLESKLQESQELLNSNSHKSEIQIMEHSDSNCPNIVVKV
jgi:hypothetical protein